MKILVIHGDSPGSTKDLAISHMCWDQRNRSQFNWPISRYHLGQLMGLHAAGVEDVTLVFDRGEAWSYVVQAFPKKEYKEKHYQAFPPSDKFFILHVKKHVLDGIVAKWVEFPGNTSFMLPG